MKTIGQYNAQRAHHNIIGFYGEPKAPAYLAKAITFYGRLFLFPFSVEWSESQRTYRLVSFNSFQKGMFLTFVFGNTISFMFWVSTSIQELLQLTQNPSGEPLTAGVLILACLLLTWLSVTTGIIIIWIRKNEICNFLKELQDSLDVLHLPSAHVWMCPVLFYFASTVTSLCTPTGQVTVSHGAKMMTDGIVCVFKRLGLELSPAINPSSPVAWLSGGCIKLMEGFFKLIIFHGGCFCSMPHALLLTISLGLRQVGKEIQRTLESGTVSAYEGLQIYYKVKTISSKVNEIFGAVMLTHYMCNLTYAIQTPFLFHETGQVVEDVNYLWWLFVSWVIWWTGSEFHRLAQESMKNWIQSSLNLDMAMDDRVKLSTLSNCIDKDNIGLYCRYFLVTHRFLTTTCGAVVTYGIIMLQVKIHPAVELCRDES